MPLYSSSSRVSNRFHLAHHSTFSHELEQKQTVYISQPEHHQIIRLKKVSHVGDDELEINSEAFIGNGERCLPGDSDGCGDGGKAINARLTYPKGLCTFLETKNFTNFLECDAKKCISTTSVSVVDNVKHSLLQKKIEKKIMHP